MKHVVHIDTQHPSTPLAVFSYKGRTGMLVSMVNKKKKQLTYSWSVDGFGFSQDNSPVVIYTKKRKKENVDLCSSFSIAHIQQGHVLTYIRTETKKIKKGQSKIVSYIVTAFSKNFYEWHIKTEEETESRTTVFLYDALLDKYMQYRDGLFLRYISSPRFGHWPKRGTLLATSRMDSFDNTPLSIVGVQMTDKGILLFYNASASKEGEVLVQIGALLLDSHNPHRVLWRTNAPIVQSIVEIKEGENVRPLGIIYSHNSAHIYWLYGDRVVAFSVDSLFTELPIPTAKIMKRSIKNPIIRPHSINEWEVEGTFNPAAFEDSDGNIHLLYRAVGRDGISRVGLATSKDGVHFGKRFPYPVYEPRSGYGMPHAHNVSGPVGYYPSFYTSGGGWGGSEDPRVVCIDGRLYMTYVAFEGWNFIRIALTSISVDDFKAGKWNWTRPTLISPPGQPSKNWVLFPEKINGKYAILHGVSPEVLVDYVDSLDDFKTKDGALYIQSASPRGGRQTHWDSSVRGAGPPPVKIKEGWLLLYHAMDRRDPGKYKLGGMILDSADPTKILYRTHAPILSPDTWYENDGKPGVVYASGALVRDDELYVYYGGGDKVVCVATAPLKEFVEYIKTEKPTSPYMLKKSS